MSLQILIEELVNEVLLEINSISVGGAALSSPNSVKGLPGTGFGIDGEGGETFNGSLGDENFEQLGEKEDHHQEMVDFMWNGDKPKNKPPKVRYVAV